MNRRAAAVALAVFAAVSTGCRSNGSPGSARIAGGDARVVVRDGDELVTEYRYGGQRVPCLYPLFAPGGVPMTRAFPIEVGDVGEAGGGEEHDHPHHLSMWLAHGDVSGNDFWHDPQTRIENGDAVLCDAGLNRATIRARNLWLAHDELVVIEDRVMRFRLDEDRRVIDFDIRLSPADEAVTFGDTKEGSFAVRMHPELRLNGPVAKGSARNSEGVTGAEVWGKRARWIAYFGPVEGTDVVLAMMDHPKNPRHPTWWHARDYGLCAANPFGESSFGDAPPAAGALRVGRGETLRLRYRIVLRTGGFDADEIEDDWREFAD